MIVGASLDETVPVPCHVAADPLDVSFDWNFSNSGERFEVASGQFNLLQDFHSADGGITQSRYDADEDNSETIYELLYTPKSEREYGTLACWAKNSIGKQLEPCLFQVVPAAKPAPLRNCTLRPYSTLLLPASVAHGPPNGSAASAGTTYYSYYAGGGQPRAPDTNYIGPQFVKDRNVPGPGLRRPNVTKFNQKNPGPASSGATKRQRNRSTGPGDDGLVRLTAEGAPGTASSERSASLLNTATAILLGESASASDMLALEAAEGRPAATRTRRHASATHRGGGGVDATPSGASAGGRNQLQRNPGAGGGGNNYHPNGDAAAAAASAAQLRSKAIRSGGVGFSASSYGGGHHHHHHFIDQPAAGGGLGSMAGPPPGGLPELPTMMELECVAGYDGGLPQHFFLEAYDSRTRKLRLNITSALNDVPLFRIDLTELSPGDSYTPTMHLIAYSVNQKGRSEPTILEDIAINEAEKRA
ncbi:uncharacterized protein LOC128276633, partial [Anopheles cruzii]|uniref:uncharacterized protein LOC128276633 n=1 Tax=Anopheles cruzii TaxID=68878 RepID=UPI0022EC284D